MIEFPTTKPIKDSIRQAIGQPVTFVIQGTPTACPTCSSGYYDPVNESSLNPFCQVCSGVYWLPNDDVLTVTAHVRWRSADIPERGVAGETFGGDCIITVSYTDLTNNQVDKIKEIIADSRKLEVTQRIYRGVPTRDRIRFVCREYAKE